jgi:hypothetical protein
MRPVVSRQEELVEWIAENPSPRDVRAVVRAINEKIVISGPLSKRELLKYLLTVTSNDSQNLLTAMLESFAYIHATGPNNLEDSNLAGLKDITFPDLAFSDELEHSIKLHTHPMLVGESRDSGFLRLFGHFLEGALTVEIFDRYFAEKLAENEEVINWLVQRVSLYTKCPIRITSRMPRDKISATERISLEERLASLANSIAAYKKTVGIQNEIYLDLFERVPHNRFLRVQFTSGAVYCVIHHGVDAFKSDPINEPEPVQEITKQVYADIQRSEAWVPRPNEALADWNNKRLASDLKIFIRLPKKFSRFVAP